MRKLAAVLLCLVLQPLCVAGQKGSVKGDLGKDLDGLMTRFAADGYSGAVLVARRGEVVPHKVYGLADCAPAIPSVNTSGRSRKRRAARPFTTC